VRKLKVDAGKPDKTVWDKNQPGFAVRKYAKGHASYIVKYHVKDEPKPKKARLGPVVEGNLKAMRLEAADVITKARQGVDVFKKKKDAAEEASRLKKLGELIDAYLKVRETGDKFWKPLKPASLVNETRYLKKSWAPLHHIAVEQITRQQVKARRDEIADESGATSANRAHTTLLQVFGRGRRSVGSDDGHNQKRQMEGQEYQRWVEQAGHWRSARRDQGYDQSRKAEGEERREQPCHSETRVGWPLMSIGMGQEPLLGWTLVVKKRFNLWFGAPPFDTLPSNRRRQACVPCLAPMANDLLQLGHCLIF
jgi:hypothetical protein